MEVVPDWLTFRGYGGGAFAAPASAEGLLATPAFCRRPEAFNSWMDAFDAGCVELFRLTDDERVGPRWFRREKDLIKSLEGLRGTAALMVALHHLKIGESYIPLIKHGYLFVDLFFVLSGFVIVGAYGNRMQTWPQFFSFLVRRWGRLFPLLAFSTAAYVLAIKVDRQDSACRLRHGRRPEEVRSA